VSEFKPLKWKSLRRNISPKGNFYRFGSSFWKNNINLHYAHFLTLDSSFYHLLAQLLWIALILYPFVWLTSFCFFDFWASRRSFIRSDFWSGWFMPPIRWCGRALTFALTYSTDALIFVQPKFDLNESLQLSILFDLYQFLIFCQNFGCFEGGKEGSNAIYRLPPIFQSLMETYLPFCSRQSKWTWWFWRHHLVMKCTFNRKTWF